jgi:putative ABC transport system substrate-binding protein
MEPGLRKGLHDLGYIENRNILIEWRYPTSPTERTEFAAEFVRFGVDVIVTAGTPAAKAAMATTSIIPVVFYVGDPLAAGLAVSLARPGMNGTGISIVAPDLSIKQLEFLHQLVPRAKRFAFLGNAANPAHFPIVDELHRTAASLGVQVEIFSGAAPDEIDLALKSIRGGATEALIVSPELAQLAYKVKIIEAVRNARMPAIYAWREYHEIGALMSYGFSADQSMSRAALYVHRLLKGAKAAELPVEQISRYELVIDMREARALSIIVPEELLVRADKLLW